MTHGSSVRLVRASIHQIPRFHNQVGLEKRRFQNPYGVISIEPLIISADIKPAGAQRTSGLFFKNGTEMLSITRTPDGKPKNCSGKFVIASDGPRSKSVRLFALLISPNPLSLSDWERVGGSLTDTEYEKLDLALMDVDRLSHPDVLSTLGRLGSIEIHFNHILGGGVMSIYPDEHRIEAGFASSKYGSVCPSVLVDCIAPHVDSTVSLHGFPEELVVDSSLQDVSVPPMGDRTETDWYHRRGIKTLADLREALNVRNSIIPSQA